MGAYPQGNNKERKLYLDKRSLINCKFCPYHGGENWRRKQRPDKYKTRYRIIRKFKERINEL